MQAVAALQNLLVMGSLHQVTDMPETGNCQRDTDKVLVATTQLLDPQLAGVGEQHQRLKTLPVIPQIHDVEVDIRDMGQVEAEHYVSGFIVRKIKGNCLECAAYLKGTIPELVFIQFKDQHGQLVKTCQEVLDAIGKLEHIFEENIDQLGKTQCLYNNFLQLFRNAEAFKWLYQKHCIHAMAIEEQFCEIYFTIKIHSYTKKLSARLAEEVSKQKSKKNPSKPNKKLAKMKSV